MPRARKIKQYLSLPLLTSLYPPWTASGTTVGAGKACDRHSISAPAGPVGEPAKRSRPRPPPPQPWRTQTHYTPRHFVRSSPARPKSEPIAPLSAGEHQGRGRRLRQLLQRGRQRPHRAAVRRLVPSAEARRRTAASPCRSSSQSLSSAKFIRKHSFEAQSSKRSAANADHEEDEIKGISAPPSGHGRTGSQVLYQGTASAVPTNVAKERGL